MTSTLFQCPLNRCKTAGSHVHSLTLKKKFCLHNYLILKAGLSQVKEEEETETTEVKHEFDRGATIDSVLELIMEHLPTATEDNDSFLRGAFKYWNSSGPRRVLKLPS